MNSIFLFWSTVLVMCLTVMGLSIRSLAVQGIPLSESMIVRGLACLAIVIVWARYRKWSLKPKSVKTQVFRALIAGFALTFFSMSYNWLSASTVSVLSNVDVPMLVILGAWVGQKSTWRAKVLSLVSILLLGAYGIGIEYQPNLLYGITILSIGLFLLCFGYFFIKKSMTEENYGITILTPALAIIVYGFAQKFIDMGITVSWNLETSLIAIISGACMFGAYYATMKLYTLADIATAEFPTLISSVAIQPMEAFLFNEPLIISQVMLTIVFVGVVYLILKLEDRNGESSYAS